MHRKKTIRKTNARRRRDAKTFVDSVRGILKSNDGSHATEELLKERQKEIALP